MQPNSPVFVRVCERPPTCVDDRSHEQRGLRTWMTCCPSGTPPLRTDAHHQFIADDADEHASVIEKRQPAGHPARQQAATILDLTSRGEHPWVMFSPFWPHGEIPVPFSPGGERLLGYIEARRAIYPSALPARFARVLATRVGAAARARRAWTDGRARPRDQRGHRRPEQAALARGVGARVAPTIAARPGRLPDTNHDVLRRQTSYADASS